MVDVFIFNQNSLPVSYRICFDIQQEKIWSYESGYHKP